MDGGNLCVEGGCFMVWREGGREGGMGNGKRGCEEGRGNGFQGGRVGWSHQWHIRDGGMREIFFPILIV